MYQLAAVHSHAPSSGSRVPGAGSAWSKHSDVVPAWVYKEFGGVWTGSLFIHGPFPNIFRHVWAWALTGRESFGSVMVVNLILAIPTASAAMRLLPADSGQASRSQIDLPGTLTAIGTPVR